MSKDDWTKTTFRLPLPLLKEAKHYGLDHDMTDTDIFNEALREYLDSRSGKKKSDK